MTTSPFIVRPALSQDELEKHIEGDVLVGQSFSPEPLPANTAQLRLHKITTSPSYRPEQVRDAYREGIQLGGYHIDERLLRIGDARLVTGCIGGVYTRPEARNQGVATALMNDANAYAEAHKYPLLLLDGIPKFYHRYGYCDVYDLSTLELDHQAILSLSESPYIVRKSQLSDAPSLLALYDHHLGLYTGSFERSIEQQTHWMQHLEPGKLLVAIDPADQVRGYLFLGATQAQGTFFLAGTQLWELVVDDWSAAVALLQYHVRLMEGEVSTTASETFLYNIPSMSPLADFLVENLEVPDISTWDMPVLGWSVREQTFRHRNAAWMARLVSLPPLVHAMLPEWQTRWRHSLAQWTGDICITVGNDTFTLRIAGTTIHLLETSDTSNNVLSLTPQAFIQAVFGYSSIVRSIQQNSLSDDLATVLGILFPTGQTWIPASDWF